jgi:hypothetical protein
MKKVIRLASLMVLIVRRGKFRHSGYDYEKARKQMLSDVMQFSPVPSQKDQQRSPRRRWFFGNNYVKAWSTQAAFAKNALKSKAGHISAPHLNLSYIRIPKAASTALSSAMLHARFPELKKYAMPAEKINFLTDVNLQKDSGFKERKGIFFTVIRNPFSRIVSVYREFFERQSFPFIYEDYLFGILRKNLSFKEFLNVVQLIPDNLKDQHLKPQNLFLKWYQANNISVRILKLEEPATLKNFLSRYDLPLESINKSEQAYDYREYYDQEILELVHDLYSEDIFVFGYEEVYQQLKTIRFA